MSYRLDSGKNPIQINSGRSNPGALLHAVPPVSNLMQTDGARLYQKTIEAPPKARRRGFWSTHQRV
jgi:hypothetical protein